MNLTPADLGSTFEKALLERRGHTSTPKPTKSLRAVAVGAGLVVAGLGLYVREPGMLLGAGVISTTMAFGIPQMMALRERQRRENPLTPAEIASLRPVSLGMPRGILPSPTAVMTLVSQALGLFLAPPTKSDGLEDAFASLVADLARLEVEEESLENELKRTLRALGEAVGDLPAPPELPEIDIADLVADAEVLLMRARREKDEVIAGSLQRQAEATVRRARATADALKLARRTRTLRQEVLAQIEGCRVALPGLARTSGASSGLGVGRFTSLAEQVQGIAREAG
jgi:hypothetical protein